MQPVVVVQQPVVAAQPEPAPPAATAACKMVGNTEPYLEYCGRCQANVTTRVEYKIGSFWWLILLIGVYCWLCCKSSKDAHHYCPQCGTELALKKGGC